MSLPLLQEDSSFRQVKGRNFYLQFVTGSEPPAVGSRFLPEMREQPVPVREFHSEQHVFEDLDYGPFNFKGIFSWHVKISRS